MEEFRHRFVFVRHQHSSFLHPSSHQNLAHWLVFVVHNCPPFLRLHARLQVIQPQIYPSVRKVVRTNLYIIQGLCLRVAPQYADEIDPDMLVTAAILHDMGKVRELAWKSNFSYTTEGQLLGHITIGIGLLRDKAAALVSFPERLRILLEHIILSHHGKYEFGSPKLPMTPEALVFSALDDLEAKMQNMRAEFAKAVGAGRGANQTGRESEHEDTGRAISSRPSLRQPPLCPPPRTPSLTRAPIHPGVLRVQAQAHLFSGFHPLPSELDHHLFRVWRQF